MPLVDLHAHSTVSDGVLPPGDLVAAAAGAGVEVFALTDHDTTRGLEEALTAASAAGIRLVPGMEISAHQGEHDVHILAYFGAGSLERLGVWQEQRRQARWERLERILARLTELGMSLAMEQVLDREDVTRTPGRPHVARALVAAGHVPDVRAAFDRYLAKGGPAYVRDRGPDAATAIELVHALPGLTVIAHSGLGGVEPCLPELIEAGLDGIEVFHPGHPPEVVERLHARAREQGLLVTGGSDFHGSAAGGIAAEASARLGSCPPPPAEWERFEAALARLGAA